MSAFSLRVSIQHDQWDETISAFAWISSSDGKNGYRYAEVLEGECGLCGRTVAVLQMTINEAERNVCEECIAKLFDSYGQGTSYVGDEKRDALGNVV